MDDEDIVYLGNNSKYKVALCEYWTPFRHGSSNYIIQDKLILYNYLDYDYLFNEFQDLTAFIHIGMQNYDLINNTNTKHKRINNYLNIISKKNYIQPEIVEVVEIKDNDLTYTTCIKKTFWLRIFQRKFKKYYNKKIQFMKNIFNLRHREINGKYPRFT
tara:strand:- start:1903 stop:2379 length:477 start_codon:yes stop_codon:yes gene_type:complete